MKLVDFAKQVFDSDYVKGILNDTTEELAKNVLSNINDILERETLLDDFSKEFIQMLMMNILLHGSGIGAVLVVAYELGAKDYQWQEFVKENYPGGE